MLIKINPKKLKRYAKRFNKNYVFILIFALVGVMLLVYSLAATSTSYFEAESGTMAEGSTVVNDSGASGGKAAQFGTSVTGSPKSYSAGLNPAAGATIIAPVIDCNFNVQGTPSELPAGIIIENNNITIINPQIKNCSTGIQIRPKNGVAPQNIKVIASASYGGYTASHFTHNRCAIRIQRGVNIEIGDVSAPSNQIGGELYFENNYKHFEGNGGTDVRIHHTTSRFGPNPSIYSPQTTHKGAIWGYKWLADRSYPAPREVARVRYDHNDVSGYFEEGLGVDSRGNTENIRSNAYEGTVQSKTTSSVSLSGAAASTSENLVGLYVIFNEGNAKGESLKITSRSGGTFNVADPENVLSKVSSGNRVTVGMRFYQVKIDNNIVHATNAKTGIDFHGSTLYSRIESNRVIGKPTYIYPSPFHFRSGPQCMNIRSMAGPYGDPAFSLYNSVVNNSCESSGDISSTIISWGTYEVDSPTWMSGNKFSGTPTGQEWRYKSPQPASDPWRDYKDIITPATGNLGTVSGSVSIPTNGTYRVWSRIKAPDSTNNSYHLQIGNDSPVVVGDSSIAAGSWVWVDYAEGSTGNKTDMNLTAGTKTIKMTGREPGVKIDKIVFTTDLNCVPTGTGDNCSGTSPTDTTAPSVSITTPVNSATVSGNVQIQASASDTGTGVQKVDFLIDGALKRTENDAPYEYFWDSTSVANGSHTITVKATDNAGNISANKSVTVNVQNSNTDPPPSTGTTVRYRVNAGGPAISDTPDWQADTSSSPILYVSGVTNETFSTSNAISLHSSVPSGTPTALFQTERFDTTPATPMKYAFPVTSGKAHKVRLYFAEIAPGLQATGARILGVSIEGNSVLSNYDTFAAAGGGYKGHMKEYSVTPDGTLDIVINPQVQNVHIMGIEVLEESETTEPEPTHELEDINQDGVVNLLDFSILASKFGQTGTNLGRADINGDGKVNLLDFSLLTVKF